MISSVFLANGQISCPHLAASREAPPAPPAPPGQLEVISMLEGLQDKFVDERVSLEKEEAKKRHSYEAW